MTHMFDNYDNVSEDYIPNNEHVCLKIIPKYADTIVRGADSYQTYRLPLDASHMFKSIIIYYKQGLNIIMSKQLTDSGVELEDNIVGNDCSLLKVTLSAEETLNFKPTNNDSPIFVEIHMISNDGEHISTNKVLIRCVDSIAALDTIKVTWVNYDDTCLDECEVLRNDLPLYHGELPTRESTEESRFTFNGWLPSIAPATSDITYKAYYIEEPINSDTSLGD